MDTHVNIIAIDRHRIGIDGEGITTLVTLYDCPLHCRYCLNDMCHIVPHNAFSANANKVVEICMIDNLYFLYTKGGITIGGGEPLLKPEFIHELRTSMPDDWSLNIETSLNIPKDKVRLLLDDVSMWIIDIKDMNPSIYEHYTQCSNTHVLDNLHLLADKGLQSRCTIRVPLIPGYNSADDQAHSVGQLKELGFTLFDLFEYKTERL